MESLYIDTLRFKSDPVESKLGVSVDISELTFTVPPPNERENTPEVYDNTCCAGVAGAQVEPVQVKT